jgi:hypothetical protein
MAINVVNKDLEAFQFQEGRPTQSTPVTYRPTRPLLPFTILPGAKETNGIQGIKNALLSASNPSDADAFLTYRGTWQSFINYSVNDVVLFNGSTYVAIQTSTNSQPDNNHDAGPAEGSAAGSSNWTLLSENFVFNPAFNFSYGYGMAGVIDQHVQNRAASGHPHIGPATPATSGEIAILAISQRYSDLDSTWAQIANYGPGANGVAIKALPTITTLDQTLGSTSFPWTTNLVLLKGSFTTALQSAVTQVQVTSNVCTITCPNSYVVGQNINVSVVTASFANGIQVVTAATSTTASFALTHANYGPTADTGTVNNLLYYQLASQQYSGDNTNPSNHTISFTSPVHAGSVLIAAVTSSDSNANGNIASVTDNVGNTWTIYGDPNTAAAALAVCLNAKAGSTTLTVNGIGSTPAPELTIVEFVGAAQSFVYVPYDVVEFRGSIFVCLKETSLDAFAAPAGYWGLVGPASGFVQVKTGNYTAVQGDEGNLLSFNSASAVTLTLPNPIPPHPQVTNLTDSGWMIWVEDIGAGTLTINPNGLNIDGSAASLSVFTGQGFGIFTDGINYFTFRGGAGFGPQNAKTALMGPVACSSPAVPTFRQPQGTDLVNLNIASASGTLVAANVSGNLQLCGAVLPAGLYRISVYLLVTTVGPGNLGCTLTWNDGTASQSVSPATITTTVKGTVAQFNIVVLADGINNIAYTFTLS